MSHIEELTKPSDVKRVAIVGAGTIGSSWAAHFLGQGMEVRFWDPAPDCDTQVRSFVDNAWPALERLGLCPGASLDKLHYCPDIASALDGAQFVQESAPEVHALKVELYEKFDDALPENAIMATSSSGLLLSELQAGRRGASRYVLGHPFNPPHLIPLVEVLGGKDTARASVDWAIAFYNTHGKKAIRLNKEVPGHLVNRIQVALWREAIDALATGLASVEDIDAAIAYGPGLRWAVMGPHMIFNLAGGQGGMQNFLEHLVPPLERWWDTVGRSPLTDDIKRQLIDGCNKAAAGRSIDELAAQRDQMLLDLMEALNSSRASQAEP